MTEFMMALIFICKVGYLNKWVPCGMSAPHGHALLVPFTSPWTKCNCLGNQLEIMGKSVHWPQLLMDKYSET